MPPGRRRVVLFEVAPQGPGREERIVPASADKGDPIGKRRWTGTVAGGRGRRRESEGRIFQEAREWDVCPCEREWRQHGEGGDKRKTSRKGETEPTH